MKSAVQRGLINPVVSVFDYGCGHGDDIEHLADKGVACRGWDPAFRPDSPKHPADIVNLGFVLNVIEGEHSKRIGVLKRGLSPIDCLR